MTIKVALPSQDQLYVLYLTKCEELHISKPNKHILDLLAPGGYYPAFTNLSSLPSALIYSLGTISKSSQEQQKQREERSQQQPHQFINISSSRKINEAHESKKVLLNDQTNDNYWLARQYHIPNVERIGHLGSRGFLAFLAILKECPLLVLLDFTFLSSLFIADAYQRSPYGNDCIHELAQLLSTHPSLHTVDFSHQKIGTYAASFILEAVRSNSGITRVIYDKEGVVPYYQYLIEKYLIQNRTGKSQYKCPPLPTELSPAVKAVEPWDRKTTEERREFLALLNFAFPHSVGEFEGRKSGVQQSNRVDFDTHNKTTAAVEKILALAAARDDFCDKDGVFIKENNKAILAFYDVPCEDNNYYRLADAVVQESFCLDLNVIVPSRVQGLRGDMGEHLILISRGSLMVDFGSGVTARLGKGDYFGEPGDWLWSQGLMSISERGSAFLIPNRLFWHVTDVWKEKVEKYLPILKKVPLFQSLSIWVIARLCQQSKLCKAKKGEFIVPARSHYDGLRVILEGQVTVSHVNKEKYPHSRFILSALDVLGHEAALEKGGCATMIAQAGVIKEQEKDPCDSIEHVKGKDVNIAHTKENKLQRDNSPNNKETSVSRNYNMNTISNGEKDVEVVYLLIDRNVAQRHVISCMREVLIADIARYEPIK